MPSESSAGAEDPEPCTGRAPTPVQLALLMRQTQWMLDDLAHELPRGRASIAKRFEAAGLLTEVAELLRHPTIGSER